MSNIQFERIGVKSKSSKTIKVLVCLVFFVFISVISILSAYSYFTSSAKKEIEISFGKIELQLLDTSSTSITSAEFKTKYLTNITPGSTLNFNDITVKNSGDFEAYVLLNLEVIIPSTTGKQDLRYNIWYDVDGNVVDTYDMAINTVEPTLMAKNESKTTTLSWNVPNFAVGNDYKGSTGKVTLTAYGTQTYLPNAQAYVDKELYASYFIVSSVPKTGRNLFNPYRVEGLIDNNDGTFTSNLHNSYYCSMYVKADIKNGDVLRFKSNGLPSDKAIDIVVYGLRTDGTTYQEQLVLGENLSEMVVSNFTSFRATDTIELRVNNGCGVSFTDTTTVFSDLMFTINDENMAYEPYIHKIDTTVYNDPLRKLVGKNVLNVPSNLSWTGTHTLTDTIPAGTYTLSWAGQTHNGVNNPFVSFDDGKTLVEITPGEGNKTITLLSENTSVKFYANSSNESASIGVTSSITNLMMERGKGATTYEPYSVIQDSYNETTKTLTRRVGSHIFDGTESWDLYTESSNLRIFTLAITDAKHEEGTICYSSHHEGKISGSGNSYLDDGAWFQSGSDNKRFYVNDDRFDSITEYRAWLKQQYNKGTPVTVWYELETPKTERLFNQTITTGKNLWEFDLKEYNTSTPNTTLTFENPITETCTFFYRNNDYDSAGNVWIFQFNLAETVAYLYPNHVKRNTAIVINASESKPLLSIDIRNGGTSYISAGSLDNFMLVKGSYTAETMPDYEPYHKGETCTINDADVVNYIKGKEFVASALVMKFEDDTSKIEENQLGYMLTVEYVYDGGSVKTSSKIDCNYDTYSGTWVYNWVSNKEILTSISAANLETVHTINIYFNDCYQQNNSHFKIGKFKIEIGECPTSL